MATYSHLTSAVPVNGDDEEMVHYDFESLTQMHGQEIVLDQHSGKSVVLQPVPESQLSLVSSSNCNPEVRDDTQSVDMVLEEEIVTDTHHDVGEELLMILNMNEEQVQETPTRQTRPEQSNGDEAVHSNESGGGRAAINEPNAQTQAPLPSSSSSSADTAVPLVKSVPNNSNERKVAMKIHVKEPPDEPPPDGQATSFAAESHSAEEDADEEEAEEEEEGIGSSVEEVRGKQNENQVAAAGEGSKPVKVPREMRQLQKMVVASKVLSDFMTTSPTSSSADGVKVRKSRKSVGRPKKRGQQALEAAASVSPDMESPKRQSTRAIAAQEAAAKQKRRTFPGMLDAEDSTELSYDGDEMSLEFHSDNETNESVASGGTDSMSMKMPKVNSSNSSISVPPAPKVSRRGFLSTRCHSLRLRLSLSGGQRRLLLALPHGRRATVLLQLRPILPHEMLPDGPGHHLGVPRLRGSGQCGQEGGRQPQVSTVYVT